MKCKSTAAPKGGRGFSLPTKTEYGYEKSTHDVWMLLW